MTSYNVVRRSGRKRIIVGRIVLKPDGTGLLVMSLPLKGEFRVEPEDPSDETTRPA